MGKLTKIEVIENKTNKLIARIKRKGKKKFGKKIILKGGINAKKDSKKI